MNCARGTVGDAFALGAFPPATTLSQIQSATVGIRLGEMAPFIEGVDVPTLLAAIEQSGKTVADLVSARRHDPRRHRFRTLGAGRRAARGTRGRRCARRIDLRRLANAIIDPATGEPVAGHRCSTTFVRPYPIRATVDDLLVPRRPDRRGPDRRRRRPEPGAHPRRDRTRARLRHRQGPRRRARHQIDLGNRVLGDLSDAGTRLPHPERPACTHQGSLRRSPARRSLARRPPHPARTRRRAQSVHARRPPPGARRSGVAHLRRRRVRRGRRRGTPGWHRRGVDVLRRLHDDCQHGTRPVQLEVACRPPLGSCPARRP